MPPIYPFTAVVGQERMKRALVLNAVDPRIGGVLIRGERGTGKSTAARAMAALLPQIEVFLDSPFNDDPNAPNTWSDWLKEQMAQGMEKGNGAAGTATELAVGLSMAQQVMQAQGGPAAAERRVACRNSVIVANHPDLESVADRFNIAFRVMPMTADNKAEIEEAQLALLAEHRIDLVVLAKYMQIVSGRFVRAYENRIINIHHAFLPAFPGARPYHSARARGVKIVGATAHYVTETLDAGPIIEQDVMRVSHRDTVQDLVRSGRDIEKIVLSRAIWNHLQNKIIVHNGRTIVFH